ncbi:MAG: hypothetical protein JST54_01455 [Deltaproteobacteria bacterium]|nr:hypothetical protein [Deltaproteobacteria bacterium]
MASANLFDVSILFDTPAAAVAAWTPTFATQDPSATLQQPGLVTLASRVDQPISKELLDLRLVGNDFPLGQAYIGLKLGLADQFALRATLPQLPDPWLLDGRMRSASMLVGTLLSRGALAVVLHGSAGCVKPARQFLARLGDLRQIEERPYLAWLDLLATQPKDPNGSVTVRSYGMPQHFAAPNLEFVAGPAGDQLSLERAMQALQFACGRLAAAHADVAELKSFRVPLWHWAGRRAPQPAREGEACITWLQQDSGDPLLLRFTSPDLLPRNPSALWDTALIAGPDAITPSEYARAMADLMLGQYGPRGLALADAIPYDAGNGRPPTRVLVFENAELALYATAGLGRVRAASGDDELATAHADLCTYAPLDAQRIPSVLLNFGALALTTPAPGGLKDWDGFPPGPDGWAYLLAPMSDVPLSAKRPVAMRMLVPLTAEEYAVYRVHADRPAWYQATLRTREEIAARWAKVFAR